MNDDILKELARALDVEPSPSFAAKVRARTAELGRTSTATWLGWSLCAGALAVVAVVVAVRQPAVAPVAVMPSAAASSSAGAVVSSPVVTARSAPRVVRVSGAARRVVTEALVPSDQALAIRQLLRMNRDEAVDRLLDSPPAGLLAVDRDLTPAEIVIPAIAVLPVSRESQSGAKEK